MGISPSYGILRCFLYLSLVQITLDAQVTKYLAGFLKESPRKEGWPHKLHILATYSKLQSQQIKADKLNLVIMLIRFCKSE